jgi:hypothetical protein
MPYRGAPYFVMLTIAVIALGFWPSYWSVVGTAPWQFHAHGAAASIWVAIVLAQTMLVDKARLPLHRTLGKASLFLFPFLIGGLFAIIDYSGKHFVGTTDPVRKILAAPIVTGLVVAAAAYATVFYQALKNRRSVWKHAGYMLTTPLILFESPFSRILNAFFPPLMVTGPDTFGNILSSILWSMALELAFVAVLWWRYGDKAGPFLVAGAFIALQMVVMGTTSGNPAIEQVMVWINAVPSAAMVLLGMAIGAASAWLGWEAGKPERKGGIVRQVQAAA